jgi:hypothetical protein
LALNVALVSHLQQVFIHIDAALDYLMDAVSLRVCYILNHTFSPMVRGDNVGVLLQEWASIAILRDLDRLIEAELGGDNATATGGIVVEVLLTLSRPFTHGSLVNVIHESIDNVIVFVDIESIFFFLSFKVSRERPHLMFSSGKHLVVLHRLLQSVVLACRHL